MDFFFIKIYFIYLKDRVTERGRDRERSSICWFTPQMATKAGGELLQSRGPGASFRTPMWGPVCVPVAPLPI